MGRRRRGPRGYVYGGLGHVGQGYGPPRRNNSQDPRLASPESRVPSLEYYFAWYPIQGYHCTPFSNVIIFAAEVNL